MAMTSRTWPTYVLLINEKGVPVFGFGSKPGTPDEDIADGCAFWDTDDHTLWHYDGSSWVSDIGTGSLTLATGENLTMVNGTFTITSGNAVLASGNLSLTSGNLTLTSGDLTITSGDILIPGEFDSNDAKGIKHAAENAGGRSISQKVVNILGSLAVVGAAAAETVGCRMLKVWNTITARTLAVEGNATVAGTLAVTGTTALTGAATLTATPIITNYSLYGSKTLTGGSATTFATVACPSNGTCAGQIPYTIVADDGTDFQTRSGVLTFAAVNKAGTVTAQIRDNLIGASADSQTALGGIVVLHGGWTATEDAANVVYLKCNAASGLTETTFTMYYEVKCQDPNTITAG